MNGNMKSRATRLHELQYLLFLILILVGISQAVLKDIDFNYTGEEPCINNNNTRGYNDLIILNQDMYLDAMEVIDGNKTAKDNYNYNICAGSILDIDKATKTSGVDEVIIIYLPNTTISCTASEEEPCIVKAGDFQILFTPLLHANNTIVKGMTFTDNNMYSITGYGSSKSDVTFIDCIWENNLAAASLVVMYNAPSKKSKRVLSSHTRYNNIDNTNRKLLGYKAMSITFQNCIFMDNIVSGLIINNQGGHLKLMNTTFINNIVSFAVIGTVYGGEITITQNSKFDNNVSPFVTVFVDNDSYLNLNTPGNTGKQNEGLVCRNGIYLENTNSYCVHGGKCDGECCLFGDDSCDRYAPPLATDTFEIDNTTSIDNLSTKPLSSSSTNEFTAPESATVSNETSTHKFIGLIVVIFLLSISLFIVSSLYILQKSYRSTIGNQPVTPDDCNDVVDPRDDMMNSQSSLKMYDADNKETVLGNSKDAEVI